MFEAGGTQGNFPWNSEFGVILNTEDGHHCPPQAAATYRPDRLGKEVTTTPVFLLLLSKHHAVVPLGISKNHISIFFTTTSYVSVVIIFISLTHFSVFNICVAAILFFG